MNKSLSNKKRAMSASLYSDKK